MMIGNNLVTDRDFPGKGSECEREEVVRGGVDGKGEEHQGV
jgi:hypothetical protein